jgi:hypothetical protein
MGGTCRFDKKTKISSRVVVMSVFERPVMRQKYKITLTV